MRKVRLEVTRKSDGPTVAQESTQRLRDSERSGGPRTFEARNISLPECRMLRHDSRRAAFNRFPLATAEIGYGETSHIWVSCRCPAGASFFFLCGRSPPRRHQRPGCRRCSGIEYHAEHCPSREMRTTLAPAHASDIYHYSFDRQYVS